MNVDNITKLREVQLELLEAFINVCKEHNLKWYIMFGTLLGAMRNEGFLPWDDDIDIAMPFDDYKKLCENKEWFDDRYFLQTPIDEGIQNIVKLRKNGTTAFGQSLLECLRRGGHHGIPIDIIPLARIQGTDTYHTPSLNDPDKKYVTYLESWFNPSIKGKFECLDVQLPKRPRKVLKAVYGDWHWPNGAEVCQPCFWFFDTNKSYEFYFKRYSGMFEDILNKKIFLFGAADSLRIWIERFGLREQVVCTFDNDSNKWGKSYYGVEVRNPEEIVELVDDSSRVIIVSLWHQEIGRELEKIGINDYFVFLDYYYYFNKDGIKIDRSENNLN